MSFKQGGRVNLGAAPEAIPDRLSPVFDPEAPSQLPTPVTLFINGKFTVQPSTGVQRVARNLLCALDARLAARLAAAPHRPTGRVLLLLPHGAPAPTLRHIETLVVGHRAMPSHWWEQYQLPLAARGGLLLNLSGSAPLLARRQVCMLHDAAVFDHAASYTAAFRYWYQVLFWLLARRQTTLLTVSAFSRLRLSQRLGIAAGRLGIVHHGSEHLRDTRPDHSVLARLGLLPRQYFLAVGSANPSKNFDRLERAFEQMHDRRGVKLVIVGATDAGVFAAHAVGAPGSDVIRAGRVDDAALKALYQQATALVFPSLYEGFGLPPLEAMACACPVAASNAAAVPEVCGDAALYFDPASVDQISAAMQRLLDDPALRERLRQAGLLRAQVFSWDQAAELLQAQLQPHLHQARALGAAGCAFS
jgi:glycosyltransferase involved in cell wall biosynthesis